MFSIFTPVRKTLFFQKKMRLFNVELMVNSVPTQIRDSITMEASLFPVLILKTMYTLNGMDNTTRETTTNKQVEILFKFIVVLFSEDIVFFLRTTLVILNNLKFKYANGGNTAMIQITETTFLGIIKSFVEIAYKVVWEMSNIASRVSSLRLVTDVR